MLGSSGLKRYLAALQRPKLLGLSARAGIKRWLKPKCSWIARAKVKALGWTE